MKVRLALHFLAPIAVFILLAARSSHPYHVSVTEIKFVSEEKRLEISTKLFAEDIESRLKKIHGSYLDVTAVKDSALVYQLLSEYFQKNLSISINDRTVVYNVIGFEKKDDVVWVYSEATKVPHPDKVCLDLSLLFDEIKTQENMVHVYLPSGRKSGKVANPLSRICLE